MNSMIIARLCLNVQILARQMLKLLALELAELRHRTTEPSAN